MAKDTESRHASNGPALRNDRLTLMNHTRRRVLGPAEHHAQVLPVAAATLGETTVTRNDHGSVATPDERPLKEHPLSPLRALFGTGWWSVAILLLLVVGTRRWVQQGALPAGPDGGQWLALGRGLLGGDGRATEGAYPPLIPLLVGVVEQLAGPLLATRIVAIGSFLAVAAAFFVVANGSVGWELGLPIGATLAGATALAEPLAFGGYPQQVGFAALLVANWSLARFLVRGRWRELALATAALAIAALAHHVYFPLSLAVSATIWLLWLTTQPASATIGRRSAVAAAAAVVGIGCFLPTVLAFRHAGYMAPLDTGGFGISEAFRYGTRESPALWAGVVVIGLAGFVATRHARREPGWLVGAAMMLATGTAFSASAEPRLLPPLLAAGLLGVGFGLRRLWWRTKDGAQYSTHLITTSVRLAVVATVIALPSVVCFRGDARADEFARYYQVVDRSLLAAAAQIVSGDDGGLVVVRHDRRGWPVGWWFEGLTEASIVVGADPRWLGFPAERDNAALAARFFDRPLSGAALRDLAAETGVERLVFRQREWIGWQRWLAEPVPSVRVAFDDGEFMVLDVVL